MAFRLVAAVLALSGVLAACSDPPFIDLPNPLIGTVSNVENETGRFEVTTTAGERYLFVNANPDDPQMGSNHMLQHRFDNYPVKVTWRRDGYELVAVKIEDGPRATPTPTFSLPSTQPS